MPLPFWTIADPCMLPCNDGRTRNGAGTQSAAAAAVLRLQSLCRGTLLHVEDGVGIHHRLRLVKHHARAPLHDGNGETCTAHMESPGGVRAELW